MSTQHLLDDFQAMVLSDSGVWITSSQPLDNITEESYCTRQRDRIQAARSSTKSSAGSQFAQHYSPQSPNASRRPRSPGHCSKQGSDHESFSAQSTPTTQSPTMYSSGESWAMAQDFLSSGSKAHRSHHRRSRSHKARYYHDRRMYLEMDDWELGDVRPRVASMPCRSASKGYVSPGIKYFVQYTSQVFLPVNHFVGLFLQCACRCTCVNVRVSERGCFVRPFQNRSFNFNL